MTRQARWVLGLWTLLALVVFNVTFDWQTRLAGLEFAGTQLHRHVSGQSVVTINDGFRPMVGAAARRSSLWLGLVLGAGVIATTVASRASQH